MNRSLVLLTAASAAAAAGGAAPVCAQSLRVSGATSFRYIELRALVRDSLPQASAPGSGLLRQLEDGRVVRCIPGDEFCRDTRPGDVVSAVPVMHDLEASAWGFGQGIRVLAQMRVRTSFGTGDTDLWPRSDDAFDLLAAYAEVDRDRLRLRAGRQWKVSGLGFYNFDGASVAYRPVPTLWLETYGGRSLVRGLNETRVGGALESIEPLPEVTAGALAGAQLRYRPHDRLALGAQYQIDFSTDRTVYAELAVADAVLTAWRATFEGTVEADVASGTLNEARFRVRSPPLRHMALHGEVRRYRPYFELWTIWGAFSPVGFDEARGGVTFADAHGRLLARGEATYRDHAVSAADEAPDDFRGSGWGMNLAVNWSPATVWRLDAGYRVESGFGAARQDVHAGATRRVGATGSVALQAMLFERLYEFRLTEGVVAGLGAEAGVPLSARSQAFASAAVYRHLGRGAGSGADWTQRRASVRLQWTLGAEPGAAR